jgi:hypothetical protein
MWFLRLVQSSVACITCNNVLCCCREPLGQQEISLTLLLYASYTNKLAAMQRLSHKGAFATY